MKKRIPLLAFLLFITFHAISQEEYWFYLRAKDTLVNPAFEKTDTGLRYTGTDISLGNFLKSYTIKTFKKTQKKAKKKFIDRTFFVIVDKPGFLTNLLKSKQQQFISGDRISEEDMKIFEPNDYGLTSTIGDNLGFPVMLDYLDYLGLPQAWYYTTGSKDIVIAISDGSIDTTNIDFKDKTRILQKSHLAKGHGISQAGNAAAQGNNSYGIPGVCYDCSIYGTNYGDFKKMKMLTEAAKEGAKVINCSWASTTYNESAQIAIDSIFNKGTIIVASAGNRDWTKTKGKRLNYPSSFKNVISVSSGMYKEDGITGNIKVSKAKKYYVENITGYVGRTAGFKDNDTLNDPYIYPVGTSNLNTEVDLLAPTVGLFSFGKKVLNDTIWYSRFETTSGASPLVSGTIGLMFSLNPKLPHDEVESILKITSTNIDHIPANKPYAGHYGAGMLNTGKAVKMVHDLYTQTATAYINRQDFSRWDFKITALSKKVLIEDQIFRDKATLKLNAKNQIVVGEGTHLKPNTEGSIVLKIDPTLEKKCELRYRDPDVVSSE